MPYMELTTCPDCPEMVFMVWEQDLKDKDILMAQWKKCGYLKYRVYDKETIRSCSE